MLAQGLPKVDRSDESIGRVFMKGGESIDAALEQLPGSDRVDS
jgi:hypothetical protein